MKKFNLYVSIIIVLFLIIITFFLLYTARCNEKAVYTVGNVTECKTIILDAGHGGFDGGAVGLDGTEEKKINLQITIKLKAVLELYGYEIILTRNSDDAIHDGEAQTIRQKKVSDIKNREAIIKENPDAIFVSIHQNKFYDESVSGAQVFYSKNNELSPVLAQNISDSIVAFLQYDNSRQIKKSGTEIYLLYNSQIPSVMVECGFISNPNDLNNLKNDDYQKRLALAIAEGIINYSKGK